MISELKDTDSLGQVAELLSQLRNTEVSTDDISDDIAAIVESDNRTIITAQSDDEIVGMLVVNIVIKPGRREARIDEVVVDASARGTGLGQSLLEAGINWAKENNCALIELTSRSSRTAANKLYQKLGFKIRETNVYQLKINS